MSELASTVSAVPVLDQFAVDQLLPSTFDVEVIRVFRFGAVWIFFTLLGLDLIAADWI